AVLCGVECGIRIRARPGSTRPGVARIAMPHSTPHKTAGALALTAARTDRHAWMRAAMTLRQPEAQTTVRINGHGIDAGCGPSAVGLMSDVDSANGSTNS